MHKNRKSNTNELCSISRSGCLNSRKLDDDFPHSATADHLFVRLEDIFESVHRVDAVLNLA